MRPGRERGIQGTSGAAVHLDHACTLGLAEGEASRRSSAAPGRRQVGLNGSDEIGGGKGILALGRAGGGGYRVGAEGTTRWADGQEAPDASRPRRTMAGAGRK